jgi:hypothetical protein
MKVGSSLSRCARDIYEGKVDKNDVLVIVARTDFDPKDDDHWSKIWKGYGGGETWRHVIGYGFTEWSNIPAEDEQKLRDIILDLYNAGKIHQPRRFGAHPQRMTHHWYDVILSNDVVESNPAVKKAWNNYKLIAELS